MEDIVALHTSIEYRVYMIGFIPGFPYMGTLPTALEVPRKQTPSMKIPAGSVAIAGKQTGIYPAEVPGGWQVIGRTPLKMFDPSTTPCSFLNAGDIVQFKPITPRNVQSIFMSITILQARRNEQPARPWQMGLSAVWCSNRWRDGQGVGNIGQLHLWQ